MALFVGEKLGAIFAEPYTAIGFSEDGTCRGGAVFNNYNRRNVDVSFANDIGHWPPAFARFVADYLWNTLGVERLTMTTRPELEPICLRLGAQREGILRNWFADGDAIICGVLKHEWKLPR